MCTSRTAVGTCDSVHLRIRKHQLMLPCRGATGAQQLWHSSPHTSHSIHLFVPALMAIFSPLCGAWASAAKPGYVTKRWNRFGKTHIKQGHHFTAHTLSKSLSPLANTAAPPSRLHLFCVLSTAAPSLSTDSISLLFITASLATDCNLVKSIAMFLGLRTPSWRKMKGL